MPHALWTLRSQIHEQIGPSSNHSMTIALGTAYLYKIENLSGRLAKAV